VSPDGRWLAYISRESERWDVYVEPFRSPGERVRVSPEGGGQPTWRGDGKELFYVTPEGELMAVAVSESSGRLEVSLPKRLFGGVLSEPTHNLYAATRDGQRFLVVTPVQGGMRIHVVTNWPELLKDP
jgi:Tol biopolymer transport system component